MRRTRHFEPTASRFDSEPRERPCTGDGMRLAPPHAVTRLLPATLALLLPLAACDRDPHQDELDASRDRWEALRDASRGTYAYSVPFQSWTGARTRTRFRVENDRVVERSFTYHGQDGEVIENWTETGAALGSHPHGAPVRLIDDLYDVCADEVLTVDPGENDITLTFDDRGILDTCTYFPDDCADDCATGVTLDLEPR
jgi:hypothetical protein